MNKPVIDVPLWDEARWTGVGFGYHPKRIPFVALVFGNGDAGIRIFADWRQRFGEADEHNVLRVAFIDADIPGEDAGYTVHIGPNDQGLVSRVHRMTTAGVRQLAGFKREFARQTHYLLTAGGLSSSGGLEIARDAFIVKTDVIFSTNVS